MRTKNNMSARLSSRSPDSDDRWTEREQNAETATQRKAALPHSLFSHVYPTTLSNRANVVIRRLPRASVTLSTLHDKTTTTTSLTKPPESLDHSRPENSAHHYHDDGHNRNRLPTSPPRRVRRRRRRKRTRPLPASPIADNRRQIAALHPLHPIQDIRVPRASPQRTEPATIRHRIKRRARSGEDDARQGAGGNAAGA